MNSIRDRAFAKVRGRNSVSAFALVAGMCLAVPAVAQDAAAPPAEGAPAASSEQSEIVVTGTRIARSGFTTPTPVTVVGEAQIARQGATNIAQILNEIPAFRPQSTPATSAIFMSNLGASTADLRGLGGNRTLVLIDGRRVVASTVAGGSFTPANTVDLNLVPATLLSRVDVVTGGASAAYGSDAVAGVTNLIINSDLQGIRGSVSLGGAEQGDAEQALISLAFGTRFASDRGRFVIGGDFVDDNGTGDCYTRDWCAVNYNTVSNPFVAGSTTRRVLDGAPATLILQNARTSTASINGLVIAGPLRGTEFNSNGTTFAHNYGIYGGAGLFQSGGGDNVLPFYQFFSISTPSERLNVFSKADYELSDDVTVFLEGGYGHVEGDQLGASRRDISPAGSYQIQRDNAFLPASVRNAMAANTSLPFGRIWNDIGPQRGHVERDTYRLATGFDWQVSDAIKVDGYYQFGQTDYSQRGENTTVNSRMAFAIDSVVNPATGQIVCRATLPAGTAGSNPATGAPYSAAQRAAAIAGGCVPLNPFGNGAGSPAAWAYVTATALQDTTLKQHVAALNISGDLFELWAGPLAFAAGVEYREDSVESVTDAISQANDFHTSPGGGIIGGEQSLDVKEGYVELALPLARELPFAYSAELNGAYRVTEYSITGQVESWKIGGDWAPFEFLRFRATKSRDIRAPNLFELYGAPQSSFQTVDDPQNGGARGLFPTLLSGNANLTAEEADTTTYGAVVNFGVGPGTLRASADSFDIELEGAIATLGAQTIVTRCFQGNTALCGLVTRNSAGIITQIVNANLNLNSLLTKGWDFEVAYDLPLGSGDNLNFRVLATKVDDLITIDSAGVATNRAGQNGSGVSQPSGVPDYTINGFVTYQGNPFSAQLQVRYISEGLFQVTNIGPHQAGYSPLLANSVDDNLVEAVTYVNFNMQYTHWREGDKSLELFAVVNNLFDEDPPNNIPSSFGPTNNVLYDVIGRYYRAGIRFAF